MSLVTRDARTVWRALNGVFSVYKPAEVPVHNVRDHVIKNICRDLNELDVREPCSYVDIQGQTNKQLSIEVRPSYADNILVVGPRYQPHDIKLSSANKLPKEASGVLLFGINAGNSWIHKIRESMPTKFFRVKGILGFGTDTQFVTGRIREKTTWTFIKRYHIDKLCTSMQSSHQKNMYKTCGVDIQTQTAYELAVKGPIRPSQRTIPMIYSVKCVDFNPPEFTLEIVCMNEGESYLKELVHDIGLQLHSTASCSQIQCFQYGFFNKDLALLEKHWDLENILYNMEHCKEIIGKNRFLLNQESANLVHQVG